MSTFNLYTEDDKQALFSNIPIKLLTKFKNEYSHLNKFIRIRYRGPRRFDFWRKSYTRSN